MVRSQLRRYLPHMTMGLLNLSVYWFTMQSSSVAIMADVPTIIQSSRNELLHCVAACVVRRLYSLANCSISSVYAMSHELIPPLQLFTITLMARLSYWKSLSFSPSICLSHCVFEDSFVLLVIIHRYFAAQIVPCLTGGSLF